MRFTLFASQLTWVREMRNWVLAGGGVRKEGTVERWKLHRLAPAMAENHIQLTADIVFNKAIATERNLSA